MNTDKRGYSGFKNKRRSRASFRVWLAVFLFAFIGVHLRLPSAGAQRVVDRIVATIEGEPVTASELAELGKFQQMNGGAAADEKELLRRRVEQWIILTDAQGSRFPKPSAEDVDQEMARIKAQFASPDAYEARLRALGLRAESVRALVETQLYLARYLDARFRPTVQVDAQQIETYYRKELLPQLEAKGSEAPPLDDVSEQIRELLTQRQISERAGRWLDENRERVHVVLHGAGGSIR